MKSVVILLLVISLCFREHANAQQSSPDAVRSPDDLIIGHHTSNSPQMFFIINNDGGISGINSIPDFQCNTTISPSVVIENFGSDVLTTATLEYFVDGGMPQYYYWEGSLPPFWMDTIVLPQISVAAGSHTLDILVTEANGQVDFNGGNDGSIQFNIVGTSEAVPYHEAFDQASLPNGYFVENSDGGPSWNHFSFGEYFTFLSCVQMPFYINDASSDIDDLYMKNIDLSNTAQAQLSFNVAYAYYSDFYWDELKVIVSADCGDNWEIVYDKDKDDLSTAPFTDVPFIPQSSQWRNEMIDLAQYTGNSNVIIKFEAVNGHGNNLYVDNIVINDNVGIPEITSDKNELRLYPNPASSSVNVLFPAMNSDGNEISIQNYIGQKVYSVKIASVGQTIIPVDQLSPGAYIVSVYSNGAQFSSTPLIVFH